MLVPERRVVEYSVCIYSNTFYILRIISYVPTYSITICMYLYEDTQDGKGHDMYLIIFFKVASIRLSTKKICKIGGED